MLRVIALAVLLAACRHRDPPPPLPAPIAAEPVAAPAPAPPEPDPAPAPAPPAPRAAPPVPLGVYATGMPDGGTVNGDPRGPRAAALNAVVSGAMPKLKDCLDGAAGIAASSDVALSVHYAIQPSGKPSGVTVTGGASAGALDCARGVIESLT